jgi:hypothetical protein
VLEEALVVTLRLVVGPRVRAAALPVQPRAQRAPALESVKPAPRGEQRLLERVLRIRIEPYPVEIADKARP